MIKKASILTLLILIFFPLVPVEILAGEQLIGPPIIGGGVVTPPLVDLAGTTSHECHGNIEPDRAVIVGGITGQGLKPIEVKRQLDKQLSIIEKYVIAQGGQVRQLETVRAVRGLSDQRQSSVPEESLPYILFQRMEFDFPRSKNVDDILEQLMQMGMDRFGRSPGTLISNYNPQVVVYYQFTDIQSKLDAILKSCRIEAIHEWCAVSKKAERQGCDQFVNDQGNNFSTRSLTLQSQPVLQQQFFSSPITINYPWHYEQLQKIELMGDVTLQLSGTLILSTPKPTE